MKTKVTIPSRFVALFVGLVIAVSSQARPQTNSPQSVSAALLNAKSQRFTEYGRTFVSFAHTYESESGSIEFSIADTLLEVASDASEYAGASSTLMEIHEKLSCAKDQAMVQHIIEREFHSYSKLIDNRIQQVNLQLSYIKTPGMAVEAARMKDDLRETKELLDSIQFQ